MSPLPPLVPPKHLRGEIFRYLSRIISCVVHPQKSSVLNFENPLLNGKIAGERLQKITTKNHQMSEQAKKVAENND